MHFCSNCGNMYYLKIVEDAETENTSLAYYCRNCGHSDTMLMTENNCVSNTQIKRTEQNYNHIINEYTKYDPTLPRISTINCPNAACESNMVASEEEQGASAAEEGTGEISSKKAEIIYIRYDDVNMKYIYLCTHCDTKWKTNESK
jgi:DNA-directed RNA polymerase subunit M/transcription elongation factor TFIIS